MGGRNKIAWIAETVFPGFNERDDTPSNKSPESDNRD